MKKELVLIAVYGRSKKRKYCAHKEFTQGYNTGIDGLIVTLDLLNAIFGSKYYSLTHTHSGWGFFIGEFTSIAKTIKFAKQFFKDCNWSLKTKDDIIKNRYILKQYKKAKKYLNEKGRL